MRPHAWRPRKLIRVSTSISAAFLLLAIVFVVSRVNVLGQPPAPDALPFAKSYLLTGGYIVVGVDLKPDLKAGGFVNGTIPMSGVPANADILAAFLYWETFSTPVAHVNGATFRGQPITVVKATSTPLNAATAACAVVPGVAGSAITEFRADVLRLLPLQRDTNGNITGKRLVNDTDLTTAGLAPHTVTLPQNGSGPGILQNSGASLVVIYRDATKPLTSVVLYDGLFIQPPGGTTSQTIRGFLQSASTRSARLTFVGGSGAANSYDRLNVNGSQKGTDVFQTTSVAPGRSWSNPTVDVSSQMPGYL